MKLTEGVFISTILEERPILHGFTTKQWGNLGFGGNPGNPEVITNRQSLFESLGVTDRRHVQSKQQHTDRSILASEYVPGIEADAVITSDPQDLLSVLTADCIPLLIYHPNGLVAVIHAGWRGLFSEIIEKTLARLPKGVFAVAGPSIGPCCYEVDEDLAAQFEKKFGNKPVDRTAGNKPHLDLRMVAIAQLQNAKVEGMEISHLCTFCHPDLFFSYRRDGSSGRMMSFIALNRQGAKD